MVDAPARYPAPMPPLSCTCAAVRPSAVVNAQIRELSAGRDSPADWDGAALAELAGLRAEWRDAVAREKQAA